MPENYTSNEIMTIAAARALRNNDVCFVGIGMPSAASNLARLTHAPDITLIYESGTIATRPDVLPLSIGDGELCETALTTTPVVEMFRYWLQAGRMTVGFLGGAQIDRFANLNTTVVGSYDKPKVRLPGGGGAPEIASACGLITDLCVFEPDPVTKEMIVSSIHPGVTRDQIVASTGWTVRFAANIAETPPPGSRELQVLRELHARTARAHGEKKRIGSSE